MILLAVAGGHGYGFDIIDTTGLPSGTVYPALRRLEQRGLLRASWESTRAAHAEGRPRRRTYELTAEGRALLPLAEKRLRFVGGLSQAPASDGGSNS